MEKYKKKFVFPHGVWFGGWKSRGMKKLPCLVEKKSEKMEKVIYLN